MKFPFNWYNKFGTIPSSYREAMSYEEQILWLCQQIENLKLDSGNLNYNMLVNKPSINGVTLEGNINSSQLGLDNYNYLLNKPAINGISLLGNRSLSELDIQEKLIAGTGIRIIGNTISATGGGSGGSSNYDDLYNKPSINGIVLAGDLKGREAKLQDSLMVNISSEINNNYGKIANLASYQTNDIIPVNIPEASHNDASYIVLNAPEGSYFEMTGTFDLYKIDKSNKLKGVYSFPEVGTNSFESLTDGTIVINFFDLGTYTAELKVYPSGKSFSQKFEEEDKNIEKCSFDLNAFLKKNYTYESLLANAEEGLFTELIKNNPLPEPTQDATSRYIKIAKNLNYSCIFEAVGQCNGSYMWFTTEDISGTEYLLTHSEANMIVDGNVGVDIPEEADYIYFQFTNYDAATNVLEGLKITDISSGGGSGSIMKLNSDLVLLSDTQPSLASGLYILNAQIFIGSSSPSNLVYDVGDIIYYEASSNTFYGDFSVVQLTGGSWGIRQNSRIDAVTLSNSRMKIPSSLAVTNAIQNATSIITPLENNITLTNEGTISDLNGTLSLESGFYLTKNVYYVSTLGTTNLAQKLSNNVCYYDEINDKLSLTGLQTGGLLYYDTYAIYIENLADPNASGWDYVDFDFYNVLTQNDIDTQISSSSTNTSVPSSLAVYNALQNGSSVIKLTSDLVLLANTSPSLTTGVYVLNASIYIGSSSPSNLVFDVGELVYYDSSVTTFYGDYNTVELSGGTWGIRQNSRIEDTLTDSRIKIPTSHAVYDALDYNFIQIRNSSDYTVASTGTWNKVYVPLTSLYNSHGNSFSQNTTDGSIVIGSNVSRIKATITYAIKGATAETAPAIHKKENGTSTWTTVYPAGNFTAFDGNSWTTATLSTIIDVNEGDEIMLGANSHVVGNLIFNAIGTVLLVEKIS